MRLKDYMPSKSQVQRYRIRAEQALPSRYRSTFLGRHPSAAILGPLAAIGLLVVGAAIFTFVRQVGGVDQAMRKVRRQARRTRKNIEQQFSGSQGYAQPQREMTVGEAIERRAGGLESQAEEYAEPQDLRGGSRLGGAPELSGESEETVRRTDQRDIPGM